jgi:beta-lactam-binding protein with PASTA domain
VARVAALLLLATVLIAGMVVRVPAQSTTINGHTVQYDASGKLLAWPAVQGDAYDQVIGLATNALLNSVPTAANGLPLYYSYSYATGDPLVPANWPHNPGSLYSMLTDSGLAYSAYSGNSAMATLVGNLLTYDLDNGLTKSNWDWPSVPFASADAGDTTYAGAKFGDTNNGQGDGSGIIEPDKVGELGVAFLKYYEYSGLTRFRDAAIQNADVLASHVRAGDATHSPWPFRVDAQKGTVREEYTAQVITPIHLFDELIRLNLGNVSAYQTARQTAWTWLMTYPIQNNVWSNYFEDVPIQADTSNNNQLTAAETARYLMRHPELDPNWETHTRNIIAWIEANFLRVQFGVNTINEQDIYLYAMGSHTSRYASLNAELYERTGDQAALEKAYRSLNWATYMCSPTGICIDSPDIRQSWFTDGYGDYIKHFLEGMGAVPTWAPASQTHLLRSTSIVQSVQYLAGDVIYQTFDGAAQEVFRLNFVPQSVTAGGVLLPLRNDLAQEGWTFDGATGVLRVRHDASTQVHISSSLQNGNVPPTVVLDGPPAGTYVTPVSLQLSATAGDSDGSVDHVDFLQNGSLLATDAVAPYGYNWTAVPAGTYSLTAVATDDLGAKTTSAPVQVVVSTPALPPGPTSLGATVTNGVVTLTWMAPPGGAAHYNVYRSTTNGFIPSASTLIGQPTTTTFTDSGLAPNTYYYRVTAVDAIGTESALSNQANAIIPSNLATDKVVFVDGAGARTSPAITTSQAGELLLAFVAADGPSSSKQTFTVSGAGLTWALATRVNTQPGTSEIWKAVASGVLTNATVTSTPGITGYAQSLTVVTFIGANATGASATAAALNGQPAVTLVTTKGASLVYGVGNDWDNAIGRTPGSGQAIVHQYLAPAGDTLWSQNLVGVAGAAGSSVTLIDTAPASDRWNFAAVEIPVAAPPPQVAVPNVVNLAQAAATTAITNAGLVASASQAASTTVPIGTVISQNPVAGTQVASGSSVGIVVSTGVTVPNVVNLTQAAATIAITNASLNVGTVTTASSATVPSGSVISESPAASTQASGGTSVNLVVSLGLVVPNVVGLTQAAAATAITNAGLVASASQASSTTVPIGTVISQNPASGTHVAGGSSVNIVVSTGVTVPNVVNLTQAAATTAITNAFLNVGTVTTAASATVPSGSVISQSPAAATQASGGTNVNLVVSTGVTVPNVVNLTQAAATTAITNAGLVASASQAASTTVVIGSVISQNPAAGTHVAGGSSVSIVVSTGVTVPNVANLTQAAATTAITSASLNVGTVSTASSTTVLAGSVISQSPAAGTQASGGTSVNLVVSTGPPAAGISVDQTVFSEGAGTRTTAAFNTAAAGEVLIAFAASDGPSPGAQTLTVSGAGLTWTLVQRANTRAGTSEIWKATAAAVLTNATVTSTQTQTGGYRQSLTVVAFRGASGTGASATANGASGAPSVTLVTTKAASLVYGVGNDWDHATARTLGATQTLVHQFVDTTSGDTYWVQARTGAIANANTSVQLNDTAPTTDRWNFASVEVVP